MFKHRRLPVFWAIALTGLIVPWLLPVPNQSVFTGTSSAQAAMSCAVTRVTDGDSVNLTCAGQQVRVRLYCIDAPEMDQGQWGAQSRDYLRQLITPTVTLYSHDTDRYDRVIGEIIADGRNLNRALVQAGWAAEYPQYCRDRRYRADQAVAQEMGAGIWAVPGLHQRPWEWRRR